MNSHARFASHTARVLGYGFRSLDGDDAYLFEVSDGARKAAFSTAYGTPYAVNTARAYSLARDKSFCQRVLDGAGIATIPTQLFFANTRQQAYRSPGREREDALAWAASATFPVFCKPNQGSKGEFAEIVTSAAGFEDYLNRVGPTYDVILVQPVLRGEEHRVLVLNGAPLCSYRKVKPQIEGDGRASVRELLERARATWKAAAQATPLDAVQARDVTGALTPHEAIPDAGARLTLEGRANRAAGGDADRVLDAPPEVLANLGRAAAAAIGLGLAGVDVFDVSPARDCSDLVVIEVNANPAVETLESQGRLDLIEAIWKANFAAALR